MIQVKEHGHLLIINAPEFYEDEEFLSWINGDRSFPHTSKKTPAQWHEPGDDPGEGSDVFVTYDGGEGSDAMGSPRGYEEDGSAPDWPYGIPFHIWEKIHEICRRERFQYGVIWLQNLPHRIEGSTP